MPVTDIVEAICRLAHGNAITNTATEAINVSETSTTITRRREAITRSAVQADLIIWRCITLRVLQWVMWGLVRIPEESIL